MLGRLAIGLEDDEGGIGRIVGNPAFAGEAKAGATADEKAMD